MKRLEMLAKNLIFDYFYLLKIKLIKIIETKSLAAIFTLSSFVLLIFSACFKKLSHYFISYQKVITCERRVWCSIVCQGSGEGGGGGGVTPRGGGGVAAAGRRGPA